MGRWRAQLPQTASSPIGWGKGRPQSTHHGGTKKVIPLQHRLHSASGCPTISPQERQRGGKTPSTSTRPIRRNRSVVLAVKVAEASIRTHHQSVGAFVNPHTK